MDVSVDFSHRVVIHSETLDWVPSPMKGVDRRPLDRIGDEVARATSIVRYAPESYFSTHVHTGGEEFIVLEGVFQDEHGDYPVGSYIRNPPESKHQPSSQHGCMIFVKLWQFQPNDRQSVQLDTNTLAEISFPEFEGVHMTPLFKDTVEQVSLLRFERDAEIDINVEGGAELLVLKGELEEQGDLLVKHSWLRVPVNGSLKAKAGKKGASVWLKTGHLVDVKQQIARVKNA